MDATAAQLLDAADDARGEFGLRRGFTAGSVAAALLTARGDVFTGICLDLGCGIGFCAEVAAVAEMLKSRQTHVVAIVAVGEHGVMPPCGRCRETLAQVDLRNLDCQVILDHHRRAALRDLLPAHWLQEPPGVP